MKLSTRNRKKAVFRVIRGTARAVAGRISSNTTLRLKGRVERAAGRFQWKIGRLQVLCGL